MIKFLYFLGLYIYIVNEWCLILDYLLIFVILEIGFMVMWMVKFREYLGILYFVWLCGLFWWWVVLKIVVFSFFYNDGVILRYGLMKLIYMNV